jgi:hypothetical protein
MNGNPFQIKGGMFTARAGARGCFLTFHRVAPAAVWQSLPNRNFYNDLDFLDRLLTYLRRREWEVVTVDEALERARNPKSNARFVNFSIDDGYRDNYDLLVPLFRRHGVPITLYDAFSFLEPVRFRCPQCARERTSAPDGEARHRYTPFCLPLRPLHRLWSPRFRFCAASRLCKCRNKP